jgi:hypothetical protein
MFYNRNLVQKLGLVLDGSDFYKFESVYETYADAKNDGFSKLNDTLSKEILLNSGK